MNRGSEPNMRRATPDTADNTAISSGNKMAPMKTSASLPNFLEDRISADDLDRIAKTEEVEDDRMVEEPEKAIKQPDSIVDTRAKDVEEADELADDQPLEFDVDEEDDISMTSFSVGGDGVTLTPVEDIMLNESYPQYPPALTTALYTPEDEESVEVLPSSYDLPESETAVFTDENIAESALTESALAKSALAEEPEEMANLPDHQQDSSEQVVEKLSPDADAADLEEKEPGSTTAEVEIPEEKKEKDSTKPGTLKQKKKTPEAKKKRTVKTAPVRLSALISTKSPSQQKSIVSGVTKRLAKKPPASATPTSVSRSVSKTTDSTADGKKSPTKKSAPSSGVTQETSAKVIKTLKKNGFSANGGKKQLSGKLGSAKTSGPPGSRWKSAKPDKFADPKPRPQSFTNSAKDDQKLLLVNEQTDEKVEATTPNEEDTEDAELEAKLRASHLTLPDTEDARRASKDSIESVIMINHTLALQEEDKPEKPKVLADLELMSNHGSYIKSTIPYLPYPLAVVCLILNIFLPGTGTILSGFSVLCCGRPRVEGKDDQIFKTICVNLFVGIGQIMTITFMLVGWFWSISWGVYLVILARMYKPLIEYELEQEYLNSIEPKPSPSINGQRSKGGTHNNPPTTTPNVVVNTPEQSTTETRSTQL